MSTSPHARTDDTAGWPSARPQAASLLLRTAARWPAHSLRSYFVAVILLTSLPIALMLAWREASEAEQTRHRVDAGLRMAAQALAQQADRELRASFAALDVLVENLAEGPATPRALLHARHHAHPTWASVFLADAQGRVLVDTATGPGPQAPRGQDVPALTGLLRGADAVGAARLLARLPSGQVVLALPLHDGTAPGQWLGARADAATWQALLRAAAPPLDGAVLGLAAAGEPVAGTAPAPWLHSGAGPMASQRQQLPDGRAVLVSVQALQEPGWSAVAALPAAPLEQAERARVLQTIGTTGASLLAGVSLALLLALQVTRPLHALSASAPAPPPGALAVREIALLHQALAVARRADRAASDQLMRRADEFEALFHGSPIGLAFARDAGCATVQRNRAMDALLGTADPPAGSMEVYQDGRRLEPGAQPLQRACRTGRPVAAVALELRRADGPVRHVVASAVPLHDAQGRARGALGAVVDVTPLKTAQAGLERAHRALQAKQALVDLAQDAGRAGVLEYRFRADELVCSAGMARLLGLAPLELNGRLRDWLAVVAPDDRAAVRAQLAGTLARRRPRARLDFRVAGAARRWLSLRLAVAYRDDGRPLQMVGMAVDATGRKRAEHRQQRTVVHERTARHDAEAASRAKDAFLLELGHELRNPLGAIVGAAEVLHSGAGGPALAEQAVATVLRQTQRLTQVLDGMLDAAPAGTVRARVAADAPPGLRALAPLRVLLVDDHTDLRESMAALLAYAGHAVRSAADGTSGLAGLLAEWPDVAIVDIGMADLDGLTLARQARAAGYAGRMVAVSGYGRPIALQAARRAGFDAYLVKPVAAQALLQAMDPRSGDAAISA